MPQKKQDHDGPWNSTTLKGMNFSKTESICARYIGFDDLGHLRRWQASHQFLNSWNGTPCGVMRNRPDKSLPPLNEQSTAQERLKRACVAIFHLVHSSNDTTFDAEAQSRIQQHSIFTDKSFPVVDSAPPTLPTWRNYSIDAWGEPYNRAMNAFMLFNLQLSRWSERHGKPDGLKSKKIPDKLIPRFMTAAAGQDPNGTRSSPSIEVEPGLVQRIQAHQPVEMLKPLRLEIYWADPIPTKEDLDQEHGSVPENTKASPDLRRLHGSEWRDSVRMLYEFSRLGRNFSSISYMYQDPATKDDEMLDLLNGAWLRTQEVFRRLDPSLLSQSKIRFKTRPLAGDEVLMEWTGIPSSLEADLVITPDGGVHVVRLPSSANDHPEQQQQQQKPPSEAPSNGMDLDSSNVPPKGQPEEQPRQPTSEEQANNIDLEDSSIVPTDAHPPTPTPIIPSISFRP
ncbi:MAG: hypothetical protein Q9168_002239 [Polycauliona sp. 1 TL-2023]